MRKDDKKEKQLAEEEGKNWLEWAVFGVSLLLVLAILAYLGYQTYYHKPSSPDLQVQYWHEPSPHAPHRYRVAVFNKGGETAEEVKVQLLLQKAGEELEKVEMQLPFSPQNSKREGWVIFSEKPADADTIIARVVSYRKP